MIYSQTIVTRRVPESCCSPVDTSNVVCLCTGAILSPGPLRENWAGDEM